MAISVLIGLPSPFLIEALPKEPWKWFSRQNSTSIVFHLKDTKAYPLLFWLIFPVDKMGISVLIGLPSPFLIEALLKEP